LSRIAHAAFELACPPDSDKAEIAHYVAQNFSAANFTQLLADKGTLVMCAWDGWVAAGFLVLKISSACPIESAIESAIEHTSTQAAELQRLYVLPEYHGSGASQLLLSSALALCAKEQRRAVWLTVFSENARAIKFYNKSGFAKVGSIHFKMGSELHLDDVMLAEVTF
jgi:ribosomal protein S18 acetylase RimI-like enzyme